MDDVELHFKGQVKPQDWIKIAALTFVIPFLYLVVLLILFSGMYLYTGGAASCHFCTILTYLIYSGISALLVILFMIAISIIQLKAQRVFEPMWGVVTSEGISFYQLGIQSKISWQSYRKYKLVSNIFLLYLSPITFLIVPKHLFQNNAEWELFVQIVKENILRKR